MIRFLFNSRFSPAELLALAIIADCVMRGASDWWWMSILPIFMCTGMIKELLKTKKDKTWHV
jgi:hypothetical protein